MVWILHGVGRSSPMKTRAARDETADCRMSLATQKNRQNHLPNPPSLRSLAPANCASCAVSSVVEHYLDTVGVRGSKPLSRTIFSNLGESARAAPPRRDGRVVEGDGLLNRCTVKSRTEGSNPSLSATFTVTDPINWIAYFLASQRTFLEPVSDSRPSQKV